MTSEAFKPFPPATHCDRCGWAGELADPGVLGRALCVDRAECFRRTQLNADGRPRSSACDCVAWPCACPCHDAHAPTAIAHTPGNLPSR